MFEHLSGFTVVLVVGPQRSGTRIAAEMIASDTGFELIDERRFDVHNMSSWFEMCMLGQKVVIQCPTMTRYAHIFRPEEKVAVVMMIRDLDAIHASEKRIGWRDEDRQRELERYGSTVGDPADIKYNAWQDWQKEQVAFPFEVDYLSLKSHPMWVGPDVRRSFRWDQTRRE